MQVVKKMKMKYEQNVNIKFKQKGKGNVAIRKTIQYKDSLN
mgnify:CR=1 FL=1